VTRTTRAPATTEREHRDLVDCALASAEFRLAHDDLDEVDELVLLAAVAELTRARGAIDTKPNDGSGGATRGCGGGRASRSAT
jgi:hypothetical protein